MTCRWFREHHDTLVPIEKSPLWPRVRLLGGGLLSIADVRREDAGRLVCWLNNTAGSESVHFTLLVTGTSSLLVTIRKSVICAAEVISQLSRVAQHGERAAQGDTSCAFSTTLRAAN